MIDPELRAVVERLKKAGTEFEIVSFWEANHKPIPGGVPLERLDPSLWDAEWVPFFNLLSPDHPESAFVAQHAAKFYGDPVYAYRLADAAAEIDMARQEEEFNRTYDDSDWEVP